MKKIFLCLILLLVSVMVQPAHATLYTGEITEEFVTPNPFSVNVGNTFVWEAAWTGSPTTGWISADLLRIPVAPFLYREDGDADYANWPQLHFTSGVLDGVDALWVDWLRDGNTWYHITTLTPVGGPYNYLSFSVFSTNNSMAEYYEDLGGSGATTQIKTPVLSGVLYTSPVPIPAPILLLGTGLLGLAGFRRKNRL
jgi:hypothetical protein